MIPSPISAANRIAGARNAANQIGIRSRTGGAWGGSDEKSPE
jgi:hypothetical protein